jgi:hypothetical protein
MPLDLHAVQRRFHAATTGRDDAPLLGMLSADLPAHIPAARRVAVHRNTYFGSLIEALAAAYPVTEKLVGERFFAAAARTFIERNPPAKPDLATYGGGFGDFLQEFPPAAGVPYLGDVARLEWARVEATFAAEADPLDPAVLAAVPPECVGGLVFTFHPSARLVRSPWSVQSIWEAHQSDPPGACDPAGGAQSVLPVRPFDRMECLRLDAEAAAFTEALMNRVSLAQAFAAHPNVNLQAVLAALLSVGALVGAH